MAQQQPTKESLTKKFDVNETVPSRESLTSDQDRAQSWSAAGDASGHSTASAGADESSQAVTASDRQTDRASDRDEQRADDHTTTREPASAAPSAVGSGDAIEMLRASVVGVLDSVVREYEPQINEFTSNVAHQIVDRGVNLAQSAAQRVRAQSWVRLGLAAALGIGIVAVLGYEAEQAATSTPRARKPLH